MPAQTMAVMGGTPVSYTHLDVYKRQELYFAVQDITRAAERYDAHFVTQLTARGLSLIHIWAAPPAFSAGH